MSVLPPLAMPDAVRTVLGEPELFVLDIRSIVDGGGRAAYEAGHLPGAVHTDYARDGWRVTRNGAPGMLPTPEELAALLGSLGLAAYRHVLIVPAGNHASDFAAAARVYWTLKLAAQAGISILDGGYAAWIADPGRPIQTGPGRPHETVLREIRPDPAARAMLDEVEALLATGAATLLDARAASYFEGREKSPEARVPGRLPGAHSLDYTRAFDKTSGRLRSRAELQALFAEIPAGPVVSYCNTGHTAALNWFVLSELFGRDGVKLYDGSMTEWTVDPSRPVATGP